MTDAILRLGQDWQKGEFTMLAIRQEQLIALEEACWRHFIEELVGYCQELDPQLYIMAGEENVRMAVRLAVQRGRHCGLTLRGPLRFYVEMVLSFGLDFESDPLLPWARGWLSKSSSDEMDSATELYERMTNYCELVMGSQNDRSLRALEKLVQIGPHEFSNLRGDFETQTITLMDVVFAEKKRYVADQELRFLIREAVETAAHFGITQASEIGFIAGLMLILGHGCMRDPLYSWLQPVLPDKSMHRALVFVTGIRNNADTYVKICSQE